MPKQNEKRTNRIRNMVITTVLTAILLSVSTYAWFIGMQTVYVETFDVEIASTDSLLLSLDGRAWDTVVTINSSNLNDVSYAGHTNSWGGKGLVPMSTIGEMDAEASRVIFYEKASVTKSPGGYRMMASRYDNYTETDVTAHQGYVVFDLFVRNFTGAQYLQELNPLDEEAIYLTLDSQVGVAVGGVEDTGIENSVRVAFAQIGRVAGNTTNPDVITGITCEANEEGVPVVNGATTGICRDAQIWEPNDVDHVENAVKWYKTSCKTRTGADITDPDSFGGECNDVTQGVAYPTYAVSTAIGSDDQVDIYDGLEFNSYENSTKLMDFPYFRDSHKIIPGAGRPQFMTLAPNSITKLRIYVFLEGQDIDNYDFASIGKKISVQFGFTKSQLTDGDIDYDGPSLDPGADVTKPVIEILGDEEMTLQVGTPYVEPGFSATDETDGDITYRVRVINPVNSATPGVYYVTYDVSDWAGNYAERVYRTVTVQ